MVSTKKLMKMATKWQKAAEIGMKRIPLQRADSNMNSNRCNISAVANKGHFVVYTRDNQRFMIPLPYLNNEIFRELLKMSEEEFGLPRDGPIILPCNSFFLEYLVSFIGTELAKNEEKAKLLSVISSCYSLSSSLHQGPRNQHILVCN
ncbi:Auxin-responsive protein [Melia azedarach]|uniref:Auxin-responsive protein n=1 Tax=Melia azedarach TaxID=155640 RepID=A0ACC1XYW6_MELAZ|nr:Auxin-responsive protein [Melia azedarach]